MALPINIEDLIHGYTIAWERLMCAFANDLRNVGAIEVDVVVKAYALNSLEDVVAFCDGDSDQVRICHPN